MKFRTVLDHRRSIRAYSDRPVEKKDVKKCIQAAQKAPSWKNSQTARFYVAMSDEILEQVRENCLPDFNAQKVQNAPVLIVTTFVENISGFDDNKNPVNECGQGWGYYDLGLASENLCLEAYNLGLGTLIMGIRHEAPLRKIFSIPADEQVVSVIALGYPASDEPSMPARKKSKEVAKYF